MGAIQQGIQTIVGGATIGKLAGKEVDKLKKQVGSLKEEKVNIETETERAQDEYNKFVAESFEKGWNPTTGEIFDMKKFEDSINQKKGMRQPDHSEPHAKVAEYHTQQELRSRKSQVEKFNERIAKGKALRGEL